MHYPAARWRPVSGLQNDPPIIPIGVILHVRAGEGASLFNYFDGPSGGIESHFYIDYHGAVEQYRDTEREADANYKGNSWVASDGKRYGFLSVETEGLADGTWTDAQLDAIKALLDWAHRNHDIPLRVCPTYRSPGIGWHVMFGAGLGTDSWSNARGKVCPGPNRVKQFNDVLVPWMSNPTTEADLPLNDNDKSLIRGVVREELAGFLSDFLPRVTAGVWDEKIPNTLTGVDAPAKAFLASGLKASVAAQAANDPDRLATAVAAKLPTSSLTQDEVKAGVIAAFQDVFK